MTILILLLLTLNIILAYTTYNLLRKNELYEETIQEFYSQLSITLHNMRAIDEKQMFESDDEVGSIFEQLTNSVNDLRPLLYGTTPNDRTTEKDNTN